MMNGWVFSDREKFKPNPCSIADIEKPESQIRLKDLETLVDGTKIAKSGINNLRMFTDMPSTMVSYMEERGYHDELVKFWDV
jgi:hypothetical protein